MLTVLCTVGFWLCSIHPDWFPIPRLVFFNTSPSLPLGIYVAIPGRTFRNGDFVAYIPDESVDELAHERGWEKDGNSIFLKQAYGPNTVYSVKPGEADDCFIVDHHARGAVFESDGVGRPLPQHSGSYIVQSGQFLPVGISLRSFDGRYTGTVSQKQILCRIVPLITQPDFSR